MIYLGFFFSAEVMQPTNCRPASNSSRKYRHLSLAYAMPKRDRMKKHKYEKARKEYQENELIRTPLCHGEDAKGDRSV